MMARLAGFVLSLCSAISITTAQRCPLFSQSFLAQPASNPSPSNGSSSIVNDSDFWIFEEESSVQVQLSFGQAFDVEHILIQGGAGGRYNELVILSDESPAQTHDVTEASADAIYELAVSLNATTTLNLTFSEPSANITGLRFDVLVSCADCTQAGTFNESGLCQTCQLGVNFQDLVGESSCKDVSTCNMSDEYQAANATISSDRDCQPLTVCNSTQFESQAPTATSDRVCDNARICTENEFEAQALTSTSDRECNTTRTCDADEFEAQASTATSDRICQQYRSCQAGQYQISNGSSNADVGCEDCAIGTVDHDSNATTPCQTCPANHDLSAPGLFGPCSVHACMAGTLDLDMNVSTPCAMCPPGAYVPSNSTGNCDMYVCEAGTVDHDNNASTPCQPCQAGAYVPSNSTGSCDDYICALGFKDDDNNATTPCQACSPGTFDNSTVGSPQPTIPCDPCPQGQQTEASNSTACQPCTACANDEFAWGACAADTNTICVKCKTCPGDEVGLTCTATLNTVCKADLSASGAVEADGDGMRYAGIAIGVVAAVVLVVMIVHIATMFMSKAPRKTKTSRPPTKMELYMPQSESKSSASPKNRRRASVVPIELDDLDERPRSNTVTSHATSA